LRRPHSSSHPLCGGCLTKAIKRAKEDRKINRYPENPELDDNVRNLIVSVIFAGYFDGNPDLVTAHIFHDNQVLGEPRIEDQPFPPKDMFLGSTKIAMLMFEKKDPRFSKYLRPIPRNISLQGASMVSMGYIEACCDPIALEIDPLCKSIGGHIHVAEVTPQRFRWRIPPIDSN